MEQFIKEWEFHAFSYNELHRIFAKHGDQTIKPSFLSYPKVIETGKISFPGNCGFILLPLGNVFHWGVFLKRPGGKMLWFESFGMSQFLLTQKLGSPEFPKMIFQNKNISVNTTQYQQKIEHESTCGSHAVVRCFFKEKTHREYKDFINKYAGSHSLYPDQLVILLIVMLAFPLPKKNKNLDVKKGGLRTDL